MSLQQKKNKSNKELAEELAKIIHKQGDQAANKFIEQFAKEKQVEIVNELARMTGDPDVIMLSILHAAISFLDGEMILANEGNRQKKIGPFTLN